MQPHAPHMGEKRLRGQSGPHVASASPLSWSSRGRGHRELVLFPYNLGAREPQDPQWPLKQQARSRGRADLGLCSFSSPGHQLLSEAAEGLLRTQPSQDASFQEAPMAAAPGSQVLPIQFKTTTDNYVYTHHPTQSCVSHRGGVLLLPYGFQIRKVNLRVSPHQGHEASEH